MVSLKQDLKQAKAMEVSQVATNALISCLNEVEERLGRKKTKVSLGIHVLRLGLHTRLELQLLLVHKQVQHHQSLRAPVL